MDAYRNFNEYGRLTGIGITRGTVIRIENGKDTQVRVEYGSVWITQHGDTNDILLEAGESVRLDRKGLAVISSQGRAPLAIVAFEPMPATESFAARMADRFWKIWTGLYVMPSRPTMTGL